MEIFSLTDGQVLASDRVFVGIRGEARAHVTLFAADTLLIEGEVRGDGILDVVGLRLVGGPHRLRVRMLNSWGVERWDSLAVHVSGDPAALEVLEDTLVVPGDVRSSVTLQVGIVDAWGGPVARPTLLTVASDVLAVPGPDGDASSVGHQVSSDAAGAVRLALRPTADEGGGVLDLGSGDAKARLPVRIRRLARPILFTATGSTGLGATPSAFGAFTARGTLGEETHVTLSVDSRRLRAGRDDFLRSADPLDEARYPVLGDASATRTLSSSRSMLAGRVQRGSDFAAWGDLTTDAVLDGLELNRYRRAVSGANGRMHFGGVRLSAFGAMTEQSLLQRRFRGDGTSGPYDLGMEVAPGTEVLVLETRDRVNPQRVARRQEMSRFVDYEVDYTDGVVLFKRPVPAADTDENPVFIEVTYEAVGSGERHFVGGVRGSVDLSSALGLGTRDRMRTGMVAIRADEAQGSFHLLGADTRFSPKEGVEVQVELSRSENPDSSGVAGSIHASAELLSGALALSGRLLSIGSGYANPSNTAFRGGSEERAAKATVRLGSASLELGHQRLTLDAEDVERGQERAGLSVPLAARSRIEGSLLRERFRNGEVASSSSAAEARVRHRAWSHLNVWAEGRAVLESEGLDARPGHVSLGAGWQVDENASLEAVQRWVLPADSAAYSVTSLGLRSKVGGGTEAWGSYQLAGGVSGAYNAALVGLSNRLTLGRDWRVNTLLERRQGVGEAGAADPVRALPFLRDEEDYTALSLGIELLPEKAPYRLASKGELRDGASYSTRLLTLAGAAVVGRSLAVFSRQQYLWRDLPKAVSEQLRSDMGIAYRPRTGNALTLLGKVTWIHSDNPLALGALTQVGRETRLSWAGEALWTPAPGLQLAGRYALRATSTDRLEDDGTLNPLRSRGHFIGTTVRARLWSRLWLQTDGRLLHERLSRQARWDLAPALALNVWQGFQLVGGHRFGDLRDPDFAVSGGPGSFLQLQAGITEGTLGAMARLLDGVAGR
ncbi:MAG: hypothetical protein FIA95_01645 [Gemmatimonadetes bacterium]|nr:hypothetical protein [Gemmatimonadota bacterium]